MFYEGLLASKNYVPISHIIFRTVIILTERYFL